jgi:hypothetical protein
MFSVSVGSEVLTGRHPIERPSCDVSSSWRFASGWCPLAWANACCKARGWPVSRRSGNAALHDCRVDTIGPTLVRTVNRRRTIHHARQRVGESVRPSSTTVSPLNARVVAFASEGYSAIRPARVAPQGLASGAGLSIRSPHENLPTVRASSEHRTGRHGIREVHRAENSIDLAACVVMTSTRRGYRVVFEPASRGQPTGCANILAALAARFARKPHSRGTSGFPARSTRETSNDT